MKIYFYFSDILYLLSCIVSIFLIIRSYYNPANIKVWNKILEQESAIISGVVFFFFLMISILDSIHISNGSSYTLLDLFFIPLNQPIEYSYSKPLSAVAFIPTILREAGGFQQIYPHLKFVPLSIANNTEAHRFVIKIFILVSLYYLSGIIAMRVLFKKYLAKFSKRKLITMFTIIFLMWLITVFYALSRHLHVFGTGQIGQDIFYQAVKSIRTGLFISFMTTLIILPFALVMGLVAGFFGGRTDSIIQFIYTVIHSIPSVLLIGASLLSWQFVQEHYYNTWSMMKQADMKLLVICILLGITNWASLCRYIRAEVFKLKEMNYIKAARLLGSSSAFILYRHLLPNVMHMVIITLVLDFSYFILAESVFTYIGIGVSPITISWGNMINAARLELARIPVVWWPLVTAFGFMFTVVLVCNLLADAVRKALNPKEEVFFYKN